MSATSYYNKFIATLNIAGEEPVVSSKHDTLTGGTDILKAKDDLFKGGALYDDLDEQAAVVASPASPPIQPVQPNPVDDKPKADKKKRKSKKTDDDMDDDEIEIIDDDVEDSLSLEDDGLPDSVTPASFTYSDDGSDDGDEEYMRILEQVSKYRAVHSASPDSPVVMKGGAEIRPQSKTLTLINKYPWVIRKD